jgi:hypothetical protein
MSIYTASGATFGTESRSNLMAHWTDKHRYHLWRYWDCSKPKLIVIGLNPSTANANTDDPTMRRIVAFAIRDGYGGVDMLNIFSKVSVAPNDLYQTQRNLDELARWAALDPRPDVLFAWGAHPRAVKASFGESQPACQVAIDLFADALCLGVTAAGHPRHPLYLPGNAAMEPFTPKA